MIYTNKSLCRIRTITVFTTLSRQKSQWKEAVEKATHFCLELAEKFRAQEYTVQSIRIVTNPFGEYLNTGSLEKARADLRELRKIINETNQSDLRIRVAIGEARTAKEIALVPELIAEFGDLCNVCVNVPVNEQGFLDKKLIDHSVSAIQRISQITPRGEGNFNFTVNFNCKSLIPYFPAGYLKSGEQDSFVIGLETPDLLTAVLREYNTNSGEESHQDRFASYYRIMKEALQYHIDLIQSMVTTQETNLPYRFAGFDSSAAPSKNCDSMTEVYELLGVDYFGAAGTVEASALLTKVFKSLERTELVGFSGLMLALTEDKGLAAGSIKGQFEIRSLLTYSSVCGIGLDTVPIPGDTPPEKIAGLMQDTGTMAFRLNKPLTVRLFPVPGLNAGDLTSFESDDLCNCAVLAVP
jgi:uncharacterized protein